MRAVAVIANLIQMIIVLSVFLLQGFVLGGWTVFALFVLLMIAFLNLLVLLFHAALSGTDQTRIFKDSSPIIKRQDFRVTYKIHNGPMLTIGKRKFKVIDLSENGSRFSVGRNETIKKRMRGQLTLLCGRSIEFKAVLHRRQGSEAVIQFKYPISYDVLLEEKREAAK